MQKRCSLFLVMLAAGLAIAQDDLFFDDEPTIDDTPPNAAIQNVASDEPIDDIFGDEANQRPVIDGAFNDATADPFGGAPAVVDENVTSNRNSNRRHRDTFARQQFNPPRYAPGIGKSLNRNRVPSTYPLPTPRTFSKEDMTNVTKLRKLEDALRREDDEARRKKLAAELQKHMEGMFDSDYEKREKALRKLEERVAKLRAAQDRRKQARDRIIGVRIERLLLDAEGLSFPGQPGRALPQVVPPRPVALPEEFDPFASQPR